MGAQNDSPHVSRSILRLVVTGLCIFGTACRTSTGNTPRDSAVSKLALNSNRDGNMEIYSMNADGSEQTRVTNNRTVDSYPAWSPDGTKIAFMRENGGINDIYVIYGDGSGQQRLTGHPTRDIASGWSQDGKRIAFEGGTWEDTNI